jgi:MFS family permease
MGLTQGILAAIVAETTRPEAKGTAFGIFHVLTGAMLLAASMLAGWLWQLAGPTATFLAGATFTALALAGLLALPGGQRPARARR